MKELLLSTQDDLINAAYSDILSVNIQSPKLSICALVISGNPIRDFDFFQFLPNLVLIHADNCAIQSFAHLSVLSNLTRLEVLVLRNNQLATLQNFPLLPKLKHLDLSANRLLEIKLKTVIPAIERFFFACPPENLQSCQYSKHNSIQVFSQLFSGYNDVIANQGRIALQDCCVKVFSDDNSTLKVKMQKFPNIEKLQDKLLKFKIFALIQDSEILQIKQFSVWISEIAQTGATILENYEKVPGSHVYPTQHVNDNTMNQQLVEARKVQVQSGANYVLVQVLIDGKCYLCQFDMHSLNALISESQNSFKLNLNYQMDKIDRSIAYSSEADDNDYLAQQDQNPIKTEQSLCLSQPQLSRNKVKLPELRGQLRVGKQVGYDQPGSFISVTYYHTKSTSSEIVSTILQVIASQNLPKETNECIQILREAIHIFNKIVQNKVISENGKLYISIQIKVQSQQFPVKLELEKVVCLNPKQLFTLSKQMSNKLLLTQLQNQNKELYIKLYYKPIHYMPNITVVQLCKQIDEKWLLNVHLFENIDNKLQQCYYDQISYQFYRNNTFIVEKDESILSESDLSNDEQKLNGTFKVTARIRDHKNEFLKEIVSLEIFINKDRSPSLLEEHDADTLLSNQEDTERSEVPIQHQVINYTDQLKKTYVIDIKSPYSDNKPICKLYQQLFTDQFDQIHQNLQLTGLQPSKAKIAKQIRQPDGSFRLEFSFHFLDIGKMMWLYVDYKAFNGLIPLTCAPILDENELSFQNLMCNVYFMDFQREQVQKCVLIADGVGIQLTDLENLVIAESDFESCLLISPSIENRKSSNVNLVNQDASIYNFMLKQLFRNVLDFEHDTKVLNQNFEQKLKKMDHRTNFIRITELQQTGLMLVLNGAGYFVQFKNEQELEDATLQIQQKCSFMFPSTYYDEKIQDILDTVYDLQNLPKLQLTGYEDLVSLLQVARGKKQLFSDDELQIEIHHPNQKYKQSLLFVSSIIAAGNTNIVTGSKIFYNEDSLFKTVDEYDAGFQLLVNLNGFQQELSKDPVALVDGDFEQKLQLMIENGFASCTGVAKYYGKDYKAKLEFNKGVVSLSGKGMPTFTCDCRDMGCLPFVDTCGIGFGSYSVPFKTDVAYQLFFFVCAVHGDSFY